ncbi:thiol-disulfide oxidoreductase DCC family protein [Psychrobacillus psychrodurans]|uniref:Thiol-disulfide oxidoreductase DCC family protein n=1 Tax=Psychrobacillus psychrodurans TaxID=126157 RepID=A0A9X3LAK2_9BACI|nr:thiol-disulfide oxidoreductase DCC family protein [Psychrobacillus psychrodurans]MCZ8534457.1 thiol-disulfide oxidoreductase DCC family protein [Psychrobacillus psychrodurans]
MPAIVLFDGECNFCDASVQFIIKRDPKGYFQFAAQQSDIGETFKREYAVPDTLDSILVIDQHKVYNSSDAALQISKHLNGLWSYLYVLKVIPKPIRNVVYKFIAKNRYAWFGKKDSCMIPPPEIRNRFL